MVMDIVIPAALVIVGVFIAWKVLKGLIKTAAILAVIGVAAWLYFGGVF
jgi:hypothetical protein